MEIKLDTLADKIYQGIKDASDNNPRHHLGASIIGHTCDRWLWLSFRWIMREDFNGRMLRLFRRGQDEERPLITDLKRIGFDISEINPKTKKQWEFKDGHFAGSMDGLILSGVPDAPGKRHVLEIKTHSKKSFDALEKDGVEKSKPMHFAQMQVYCGATETERALYVAVCKDDDRIYTERVRFDAEVYKYLVDRAQRIITSDRLPEPLSANPTWYECKFCAAYEFCHKQAIPQDVSCRSCSHVTFAREGLVTCGHWESEIPKENQFAGCDSHIVHPDLVPYPMIEKDKKVFWKIEKAGIVTLVQNGVADVDIFSSSEILADAYACASVMGDEFAKQARIEFNARIINEK